MSFRRRLALFFVLIGVLPMVALGLLVTQRSRESSTGKAGAARSEHRERAGCIRPGPRPQPTAMPEAARDVRSLIAVADEVLYAAKRRGRNRCVQAEPA